MPSQLAQEIIDCLVVHQDYEIEGGFTEAAFVDWVMDGIGEDYIRQDRLDRNLVMAAVHEAYPLMPDRFKPEYWQDAA